MTTKILSRSRVPCFQYSVSFRTVHMVDFGFRLLEFSSRMIRRPITFKDILGLNSIAVLLILSLTKVYNVECISYTAGVVEFSPDILQPSLTPHQLIMKNAHRYVKIMSTAAEHDVDILVFPECGLTSLAIPTIREEIHPYLTEIPNIGHNPCDLPESPEVLKTLSCAARSSQLYAVVNLDEIAYCPTGESDCSMDGFLFYNINIALDRNGTIVAKYRKYNLFLEPEFNITKTPDHTWFSTDFGVRFGMFICFDILFEEPTIALLNNENISDYVYSTAWFSELPFLTATPVQAAWAYKNDVNLLASGYSNSPNKNTGSGIFAGRDGSMISTMSDHSATKLLIARVSDHRGLHPSHTEEITFNVDPNSSLTFALDNLEAYTTTILNEKGSIFEYVSEGFSCNVSVDVSSSEVSPTYRLVAFNGVRIYGLDRPVNVEICGIIACVDTELSSCTQKPYFPDSTTLFSNISISASSNKKLLSYPITTNKNFIPFSTETFIFQQSETQGETMMHMMTKKEIGNFIAFAIFRLKSTDNLSRTESRQS